MHFVCSLPALVALFSIAQAVPTEAGQIVAGQAPAQVATAAAASCVSSYPSQRTSTGNGRSQSLQLRLFAGIPALDQRNVQLRADPNSVAQFAVIDNISPVLSYQMKAGTLYSQTSDSAAQNLGPVGGLRNITEFKNGGGRQAFIFRNNTADAGPAFKNSVDQWILSGFGEGVYGLYSNTVTPGYVNGFIACKVEDYYQLFYTEYRSDPSSIKGCEYVGVQTTVAPVLNG